MKLNFGKTVAAAAAAGLMGVACGGSAPAPETPAAATGDAPAAPAADTAAVTAGAGGEAAAPEGKACCKGMNECKAKGGCKTDMNGCKGQNECKAKGGCNANCPK